MTALPWTLRRRRPKATLEAIEAERDGLQDRVGALLIAQRELLQENQRLRMKSRLSESDEVRSLRRQAEQDRRNVVVVSDALAVAEGRHRLAPIANETASRQLLLEVRSTVAAFVRRLPERFQ